MTLRMTVQNAPAPWRFCYALTTDTTMVPMRHLLLAPVLCATLAACAAPAAPRPAGRFTLERGQSVEVAPSVTVRFIAADDSRCPPGVRCVWAGKLDYRFSIQHGSDTPETFALSPAQPSAAPAALGGRRIVLDEGAIPPAPAPGASIEYRATFTLVPPDSSSTSPTPP
jgi:hypothetical protein